MTTKPRRYLTVGRRRVTILERTRNWLFVRYRDHDIRVEWDAEFAGRRGRWYLNVMAPSGLCCYDGWWRGPGTMEMAIAEALRGACLIEETT